MLFLAEGSSVLRFHCPMHGPQALVIITAPARLSVSIMPSRSAVAYILSLPGFTMSCAFGESPIPR